MKKIILLMFAPLLALACSLTNAAAVLTVDPTETLTLSPAPSGTPAPSVCVVTAEVLNMRESPGIDSPVKDWLKGGDVVTILPDPPSGNWIRVQQTADRNGWINSIFCERKKP
jgi:uncharacterized protein YgiM (DUF1202 family)